MSNRGSKTREERRRVWETLLDTATVLLALCAVLLLMFTMRGCATVQKAEAATAPVVVPAPLPTPEPTATPEPDFPEDPKEQELIEAALVEKGYYSDAIPLSYELQDTLRWACEANGVPFCVALGLIEYESHFNTEAVSWVGCYGLCQLNPKYFPAGLDPHENIVTGMTYLGRLIKDYDNLPAALRAYNRGFDDGDRTYPSIVLAKAEAWRQVLDKEAKG